MKSEIQYVVRYLWQGEWHRSLPCSKEDAQEAAVIARSKFAGVQVERVTVWR